MRDADMKKASQKAEEVNEIALEYHLSHAMVACEFLLQEELKSKYEPIINGLNDKRKQALRQKEFSKFEALTEDQEKLRLRAETRPRIYVEYLSKSQELDFGRTVRVNDHIVIYLPKKLLDACLKNGKYTQHVSALRKLMAHELGHTVLHTSQIWNTKELQGSALLSNPDSPEEQEAKCFAKELLRLRHDRNVNMYEDRTLVDYF